MVTREDIQATCDDIVREFAPLQVILFGSYAYGTPTEDSDVDLLVIMDIPESETRRHADEIRDRIPERFPMDLFVRSQEDMAYRIFYNDWFLREITERGKVLYGGTSVYKKPMRKEKHLMNPLTREWIERAEEDYVALKWQQQSPTPTYNLICFLSQQCVEKYLKAWLQEADIPFTRTHNLGILLDPIIRIVPAWHTWRSDLSDLSKYAVDPRYPGGSASATDAEQAAAICIQVRQAIRENLRASGKMEELN